MIIFMHMRWARPPNVKEADRYCQVSSINLAWFPWEGGGEGSLTWPKQVSLAEQGLVVMV